MPDGASATDQDMVIGEAVAAAQDYIDNLAVGQQLVINEIADRIRNADARILDVGQPNKQTTGRIPLLKTFWLCKKKGKSTALLPVPLVDGSGVTFKLLRESELQHPEA